jgi:hypothetical protein
MRGFARSVHLDREAQALETRGFSQHGLRIQLGLMMEKKSR